mgnify:CR=1 FL=1
MELMTNSLKQSKTNNSAGKKFLKSSEFEIKGVRLKCTWIEKVNGVWMYDIKNIETGEKKSISEEKLMSLL